MSDSSDTRGRAQMWFDIDDFTDVVAWLDGRASAHGSTRTTLARRQPVTVRSHVSNRGAEFRVEDMTCTA